MEIIDSNDVSNALDAPLKRELGLFSATAMVTGIVIGSGIFIVSANIARQVGSPGLMMMVWIFTAIVTMLGAMSYSKLAAAFPEAGGQYVFLKKAWGEIPAFLYGWALFLVIQTGTLAAVAVAFAKFLGVLLPQISATAFWIAPSAHFAGFSNQQAVAVAVLVLLTGYNMLGVKEGAILQNVFTVLKVLAIMGIIAAGFLIPPFHHLPAENPWAIPKDFHITPAFLSIFAVATIGSLFAADAWNNVTFIGGEIKNPRINLPKALFYGTLLVLVLYILVNLAYLQVTSFFLITIAPEDRVATLAMNQVWPTYGGIITAVIILISTFGCLNGMILAGARVVYAMAKDNLFFHAFSKVHPKRNTPIIALIGQGLCAAVLTLSGNYNQLLEYTIFTTLLFYIVTAVGMLKLGHRDPQALQMTHWYDWAVPILYIVLLTYVSINIALYAKAYALPGLGIVLLGIPIYFLWKRFHQRQTIASGG